MRPISLLCATGLVATACGPSLAADATEGGSVGLETGSMESDDDGSLPACEDLPDLETNGLYPVDYPWGDAPPIQVSALACVVTERGPDTLAKLHCPLADDPIFEHWTWSVADLPERIGDAGLWEGREIVIDVSISTGSETRFWQVSSIRSAEGTLLAASVLIEGGWERGSLLTQVPGAFAGFLEWSETTSACETPMRTVYRPRVRLSSAPSDEILPVSVSGLDLDDPKGQLWWQASYFDHWTGIRGIFIAIQ